MTTSDREGGSWMDAEFSACDAIWSMDESQLDRELQAAGVDTAPLLGRVEKFVELLAPRLPPPVGGRVGRGELVRPADESPVESTPLSEIPDVEMFEIAGTIKWFDVSKGYGFIVPDNGLPDVLLHVTCLRAGGFQTAYEGARVHCQVLRRARGFQALRVISMDESTAIHPSQLPQRTHVHVTAESGWERARVKWFNRIRGFGFLTRGEGTEDIFVHMESLRRFGFTELRPDQWVQVRWGHGSKGCMAAELRPDGIVPPDLPDRH